MQLDMCGMDYPRRRLVSRESTCYWFHVDNISLIGLVLN
ncbi:hypothetical protein SLEP1_g2174 [Rubroshorea leprosula]|uniref:Uncharacterized protein n=1 Tax=Rubroshorea leprosula TaxID=152421 RepID=A0AAV5HM48_9ROSI|nr:hypothetical protein SLEP1_g2174 [Rubroshorea leprosula]